MARPVVVQVALAALVVLANVGGCALAESGVECDDDIDNDRDGKFDCADTDCILAPLCQPCGDGDVNDAEACDDGNNEDGDGCSSRCLKEGCGDGERGDAEDCDDGNLIAGDGCDFRCEVSRCGDGVVQFEGPFNEECDDANLLGGDGCSARCRIERGAQCGNGIFDQGEECDDGDRDPGDGCSEVCRFEFCGDGVHQPLLGEQCDGDDVPPGPNGEQQRCEFCQIVRCGNEVVQPEFGEECDDGNQTFGDGCSNCRNERCGDFQIISPETCDDGNQLDGDGCNSECRQEFCGDGEVQPRLGELCDDDGPDCAGCDASRACAGDPGGAGSLCFAIVRQHPSLLPSSAALLAGGGAGAGAGVGRAVFASFTSSGVFVYELTGGAFGSSEFVFDNFSSIIGVRSADLDGDSADELLVMSSDFAAGVFDLAGPSYSRRVSFGDRVLDVSAGAVAGPADDPLDPLDIIASSRTGEVAVSFGGTGTVSSIDLQAICSRVVAAPVRNGRGVIAACGRALRAVVGKTPDAPSSALVADGSLDVGADIRDIAVGDIDGDGTRELLVLTLAPDELRVLDLEGDGLSSSAVLSFLVDTPGGDAISAADVDGDGSDDAVITSERGSLTVHLAAAAFARATLPVVLGATRPAVGDIDDDGDLDLLVGGGFFTTEALLYVQE